MPRLTAHALWLILMRSEQAQPAESPPILHAAQNQHLQPRSTKPQREVGGSDEKGSPGDQMPLEGKDVRPCESTGASDTLLTRAATPIQSETFKTQGP